MTEEQNQNLFGCLVPGDPSPATLSPSDYTTITVKLLIN